jgi:thymidylate kinase
VAAGYLHDVVEDTKYTIEDIEKEFGKDIASLVMGASEPDKSLSWEERKQHTIDETKILLLINKLVICADKINNLEDMMIKFEKNGTRDFSAFKRGEKDQKWYYTSVYKSLIYNEDENLPIFKRLKNVLDIVFEGTEDEYLKNIIFNDNEEYYNELKKLNAMKMELQRLKKLCPLEKSFVIEFSGTPRTGKTTLINNLYDFFKKGKFKTSILEEFTTSKYFKEVFKQKYKDSNKLDSNLAIIEETVKQLQDEINTKKDIIIVDRSINDRQIWNYIRYKKNDMDTKMYNELQLKYKEISKELIDVLVITYADPITSLKRDYNSSLALEKRSFLNNENITEYNDSVKDLKELFENSVNSLILVDTSNINMNDLSIKVACEVMNVMRSKYIESFKKKYKL